jgi:hypothetical protein
VRITRALNAAGHTAIVSPGCHICGRATTELHPDDDGEAGLDAYIAQLAAAAPPLSSQQRDTLALLLRRPRRR